MEKPTSQTSTSRSDSPAKSLYAEALRAHLPTLATRADVGTIFRSSGIVRFVQGGVVKTFRWADEMNPNNPYESPDAKSAPSVDSTLLRAVAAKLADARQNPPTVIGTLSKWPGTPMLVLIGVAGAVVLGFLVASDDSALTSHWPIGFAAMIFGAFLRDLGLARRVKKLWAPQSYFIDWAKVDELKP